MPQKKSRLRRFVPTKKTGLAAEDAPDHANSGHSRFATEKELLQRCYLDGNVPLEKVLELLKRMELRGKKTVWPQPINPAPNVDETDGSTSRRRRRRRRPSIDPKERERWKRLMETAMMQTKALRELLAELGAKDEAAGRRAGRLVPTEGAFLRGALELWSRESRESVPDLALSAIALTAAIDVLSSPPVSARLPRLGLGDVKAVAERQVAKSFLNYWTDERLAAVSAQAPARWSAMYLPMGVDLFRRRPEAIERVRRCQYSKCRRLFFQASPNYEAEPAKGCNKSHTTRAGEERRAKPRRLAEPGRSPEEDQRAVP